MTKIFDTNHDVTNKLPQLKAAGIETVIRYIGATGSEKYIKPAEAKAIAAAGLKLALVFEVWGGSDDFAHDDINAKMGAAHGAFARDYVGTLGTPAEAVIYAAIDNDVSNNQLQNLVLPYFAAFKAALAGSYQLGAYGCGVVCEGCLNAGYITKAWLSNAMGWNGSRSFLASGRATLVQHLPANTAGLDTDPDDAVHEGDDIGDFVPFADDVGPAAGEPTTGTMTVPPHDARWLQATLQQAGLYTGKIDGDVGPETIKAMIAYLEKEAAR